MKKLLLILLCLPMIGFGQNVKKLDEKKGFKDFKLGDAYSKWQSQITPNKISDNKYSKAYIYVGECCQQVFNYPLENIILRFQENILVSIHITTKKFQKEFAKSGINTEWRPDDFESINNSFTRLFGEFTSYDTRKQKVSFIWEGEKVILFSNYDYLGVKNGDRQIIHVIDMKYHNLLSNDGF